ncbi:putative general amidase GmdA [Aspergillus saccharolyticus JOP 1030-1]|uniref:amidase n=1 Tax=Aspergillus saccharolyticus JOP 1030-1 TaxID=1450539 RepID=A0A318Z1K3_9EURO|nr:general amidase GmdA [Aspergillus saccharolyticus JOP 1030-1]PYH40789.1 general amidase GmdA [Aspergillus saccharolyticus JOP 1030-1]
MRRCGAIPPSAPRLYYPSRTPSRDLDIQSIALDLLFLCLIPLEIIFRASTMTPAATLDATQPPWQSMAAAKRQAIYSAIPPEWRIEPIPSADDQPDVTDAYIHQYLTPREIEITSSDAVTITDHTTTGAWSALEVTEAFCHRAALAHQLTNCLLEIFFADALASARELDAYYTAHRTPLGPLHGLPVSLKDQFHVRGVDTTLGYIGWINTHEGQTRLPPETRIDESELVRELRNLGAVLFCKTSVATTLMAGETANNIIGYTWNPRDRRLSAGGSSGGEGALIAMRGSPAGFGTDIGGSIRVPAALNGIYGLRPSSGRMPYEGAANTMDGQNTILSVVGPMATSARALKLLFQAVLRQEPWSHDPLVVALPWREEMAQRASGEGLSFAILQHDGMVRPHPPVRRALALVRKGLEDRGHRVIEWSPPSHATAKDIAVCSLHNGGFIFAPPFPLLTKCQMQAYHLDGRTDVQTQFALSGEEQRPECFLQPSEQRTATQVAALNVTKRNYQKSYMAYWNSTAKLTGTGRPVDAVICPTCPYVAVKPGRFQHSYTEFVNVLDYPSAVVPVTRADRTLDAKGSADGFVSELDKQIQAECKSRAGKSGPPSLTMVDDCNVSHGAPVGLQVIGRRLEEEKVLALVEYISRLVNEITQST